MRRFFTLLIIFFCINTLDAQSGKKDYLLTIKTRFGEMHAVLSDLTPKHKANFIKLVEDKFYNGILFHRIIEGFMIQAGDPASKYAKKGEFLGNGDADYRISAEINQTLFHKRGVIAAAREQNPEKESSGYHFYIVQGTVWDDKTLAEQMARTPLRKFSDSQIQTYKTLGGSPHLDGNYTVFGQVIDNLWVVDSVARQKRDLNNRPLEDIAMKISCKKVKKKKITRLYGYQFD